MFENRCEITATPEWKCRYPWGTSPASRGRCSRISPAISFLPSSLPLQLRRSLFLPPGRRRGLIKSFLLHTMLTDLTLGPASSLCTSPTADLLQFLPKTTPLENQCRPTPSRPLRAAPPPSPGCSSRGQSASGSPSASGRRRSLPLPTPGSKQG